MKSFTFILLFVTLLAAGAAQAVGAAAQPDLLVRSPWMRFLMHSRPAAGYFILINNSKTTRTLVGASSPACRSMTLNKTIGGAMMSLKNVPVRSHDHVNFAPGSYHLMCMSPSKTLKTNITVPVTLRFDRGESQTVDFVVHGVSGK